MALILRLLTLLVLCSSAHAQSQIYLQARQGTAHLEIPESTFLQTAGGIHPNQPPYNAPICNASAGGSAAAGCTSADVQINNAAAAAAAAGVPLIIDQVYMSNRSLHLGTTGLTTVCTATGAILLGPSPSGLGGSNGLIGQASYTALPNQTAPINHVNIFGPCRIIGDPLHVVNANMVGLFCDWCVLTNIFVDQYGGVGAGGNRAFVGGGKHTTVINFRATNPYQSGTVGGFRVSNGDDFVLIGAYVESGDDAYQCVASPPSTPGTHGLDIDGVSFIGVNGVSSNGRLFIASLVDLGSPSGVLTMQNHVHNCTISVAGGFAPVRGVFIKNFNSTGDIANTVVSNLHTQGEGALGIQGAITIQSFDTTTPINGVTIEDCDIRDPYLSGLTVSTQNNGFGFAIQNVHIHHCNFGHPTQSLISTLGAIANAGDTSITLPNTSVGQAINTGDLLGLPCDNTNQPFARQEAQVTVLSVSGATVNTVLALPCQVSAGANVYDYDTISANTVLSASSGNVVNVNSTAGMSNNDNVIVFYDDGTILATTISSIGTNTHCVIPNVGEPSCNAITLNASLTKSVSNNNQFVDLGPSQSSTFGIVNNLSLKNLLGGELADSVIDSAGSDTIQTGGNGTLQTLVSDFAFKNLTLNNVFPGNFGINFLSCDHCPISGGQLFPTVGDTTAGAVKWNAVQPSETTTLSGNMTNSQVTLPLTDGDFVPYVHSYFAGITTSAVTEIVKVTNKLGSATPTISRGQLGTAAASHNSGDTVSIAQFPAVESPVIGMDVGGLGNLNCSAVFSYAAGAGNWVKDLAGCDSATFSFPSAATVAYTDLGSIWRLTCNAGTCTNITGGLTFASGTPPFKSFCFDIYAAQGDVAISNGNGVSNANNSTVTVNNKNLVPYCFDPLNQVINQVAAPASVANSLNGAATAGTGAGNAFAIANGTINFTTVGSGSAPTTGGRLPVAANGGQITVFNNTGGTITVYPATGAAGADTINGGSSVTISNGAAKLFVATSSATGASVGTWLSSTLAVP